MDLIKIGKFIADCRKSKNLTQSDLAELLGVSNRTISKWEKSVPHTRGYYAFLAKKCT